MRLLVGSFEWQFRDSHCVCWGALQRALWEMLACGPCTQGVKSYFTPFPSYTVSFSLLSFSLSLSFFCQIPHTPLLFFVHHLCLFPHLTHLFCLAFLYSLPPHCLFSSFPAWPLSLFIFSNLFFFPPLSPLSPFPFCLLLYFPAEWSFSVEQSCSGNINNLTGCVKPQWAEPKNHVFSG